MCGFSRESIDIVGIWSVFWGRLPYAVSLCGVIGLDETLLSVAEASRRLGLDPGTVKAAIAHGDLKAVKLGRSFRVSSREIERLLSCMD